MVNEVASWETCGVPPASGPHALTRDFGMAAERSCPSILVQWRRVWARSRNSELMEVTVIQGWISKWGLPLVLRTLTFQTGRHLLRPCEISISSWFCDPCHLLYHAKRAVRMEQGCMRVSARSPLTDVLCVGRITSGGMLEKADQWPRVRPCLETGLEGAVILCRLRWLLSGWSRLCRHAAWRGT